MVNPAISAPDSGAPSTLTRAALIGAALALALVVAVLVGVRYGLLILIGLGFGITLEGFASVLPGRGGE